MVGSDLNLIKWYLQLWMLFQKKKKVTQSLTHVTPLFWEGIFFSTITKNILIVSVDKTHSPFLILCHNFIDRNINYFTIQRASLSRMTLIYHTF